MDEPANAEIKSMPGLIFPQISACLDTDKACASQRVSMRHVVQKNRSVTDLPSCIAFATGYVGFDPLGLATLVDPKFLQEAEIKHGRTAMLAAAGAIAQDLFHFPVTRLSAIAFV